MVAARGRGDGDGQWVLMGSERQLRKKKTVMEMDGGNGSTAIRTYLLPKNSTLQRVKPVYVMCILQL